MRWEEGRQGSGYFKLKLFESRLFKFDIYLLKWPKGSYVDPHKDPAPNNHEHHRLNMVLKKAKEGGTFWKEAPYTALNLRPQFGRIHKFRPDKEVHAVTKVEQGTRYILSIGWLRKLRYNKDKHLEKALNNKNNKELS